MDINALVEKLNWSLPSEIQQHAMNELLSAPDEYLSLIINPSLKGTWKNAVSVLNKIGYPRIARALPQLIWLLQDLNWPGAHQAISILSSVDREVLTPVVEQALEEAFENRDAMWAAGIKHLIGMTPTLVLDDRMRSIMQSFDL